MERKHLTQEATDWFVRLQAPDTTSADREEFSRWLLLSPAHVEEYLAVTRVWGDADALTDRSTEELVRQARADSSADNVVQLESRGPALTAKLVSAKPGKRRYALAASVLVIAVAGWFAAQQWLNPSHIETAIGEQRSVALADGSVVFLNTNSEARIDLSATERRVTLEHGEARFTVAKDARRPFVVATSHATVRAVGTVFNVQALAERTAVTVIEGRVAVDARELQGSVTTQAGLSPRARVELRAGQQAQVTVQDGIVENVGPSVEHVLAWADRRLVFRDDTLADVIAEFNRYHERPIRIEDPALADLRISGTFNASDAASLLEYLARYEQVQIREEAGTRYLTRKTL